MVKRVSFPYNLENHGADTAPQPQGAEGSPSRRERVPGLAWDAGTADRCAGNVPHGHQRNVGT